MASGFLHVRGALTLVSVTDMHYIEGSSRERNEMTTSNPIPFNPQTLPMTTAIDLLDSLQTLFVATMRDSATDEDLAGLLRQTLAYHQKRD